MFLPSALAEESFECPSRTKIVTNDEPVSDASDADQASIQDQPVERGTCR